MLRVMGDSVVVLGVIVVCTVEVGEVFEFAAFVEVLSSQLQSQGSSESGWQNEPSGQTWTSPAALSNPLSNIH